MSGKKGGNPTFIYYNKTKDRKLLFPKNAKLGEKILIINALRDMEVYLNTQAVKRFEEWQKSPRFPSSDQDDKEDR